MNQAIGVLCNCGCRILLSTGFKCNHLLTVLKVCPLWRKCSQLKKAAEVYALLWSFYSAFCHRLPLQSLCHGPKVGDGSQTNPRQFSEGSSDTFSLTSELAVLTILLQVWNSLLHCVLSEEMQRPQHVRSLIKSILIHNWSLQNNKEKAYCSVYECWLDKENY